MTSVDPLLLAVAAAGLPGAPPPPRDGWDAHLEQMMAHGLAGLFSASAAAGVVDIDAAMAERLQRQLDAEAMRAVQLEGELIRLAPALERLGAVVLKGAVLAHAAYPDPLLRPFTDIDLLVPGRRVAEAVEVFASYGYQRTRPEPAPGFDARVGKALTLEHPGGVVIDLHRTLTTGNLGEGIDVDGLVAARREVRVGSHTVPAPSWEAHLVECALHAVVGDGLARPMSLRDVAEVSRHPALDADAGAELAVRWQAAEAVGRGLRAACDGLGLQLPGPLAALADRVDDAPLASASARAAHARLDELRSGDPGRRATAARALVAPSPEFLRWAHGDAALPRLYGRRWRSLYQRAQQAQRGDEATGAPADPVAPAPEPPALAPPRPAPVLPPAGAGANGSAPPAPVTATPRAPDPPELPAAANARLATVALDRRPGPAPVPLRTAAPRTGSTLTGAASGGRQEAWSRARPPRQGRANGRNGGGRGGAQSGDGGDGSDTGSGTGDDGPVPPAADPDGDTSRIGTRPPAPHGLAWGLTGAGLLATAAASTQLGSTKAGAALVPLAGLALAVAAARRIGRLHPEEAWVGRWLVLGVVAKLTASYLRYLMLVTGYEGVGDATGYDRYGRQFVRFWLGTGSNPDLPDLRSTNFLRWFTGVVYHVFGTNMVTGYFVFALLAVVGSYMWYRATVDAVPGINRRLYLGLVLFAPSVAFWPSSIGKEALMQLGIGVAALSTSFLLRHQLLKALVLGAAGGWLLWVVRPHLLALVAIATGCAYVAGRVKADDGRGSLLRRPVGLLLVAILAGFTMTQAADFLGLEDLSLSSFEEELDEQTELTSQGGSEFDNGDNSLNPLRLPHGAVTVLLRPFPWETDTSFQLLASLEGALLTGFIVSRLGSVRASLTRARSTPYLLYCWALTALYAITFSSFANFGLLVRQRSLVLPALFVLLCVRAMPRAAPAGDNTRRSSHFPPRNGRGHDHVQRGAPEAVAGGLRASR